MWCWSALRLTDTVTVSKFHSQTQTWLIPSTSSDADVVSTGVHCVIRYEHPQYKESVLLERGQNTLFHAIFVVVVVLLIVDTKMRLQTLLLVVLGLTATVKASWFGGDSKEPTITDEAAAWTHEKHARAQAVFSHLKADAFDSWDESRLREFLLEQGVVQPSGTREQLALIAKHKYAQWSKAASAYSASATSLASQASQSASTAVYGDSTHQASKSLSSLVAQATNDISRALEDSKDYVYSK